MTMHRTHPYLAAAAVTVVVVAALPACAAPTTRPADAEATPAPGAPAGDAGPGPTSMSSGVPQGWSRDEAGARAAAISAVRLTGDIASAGFITRSDMVRSLASVRYGPILDAQSAAQLAEMSGALATGDVTVQSVMVSELPLTAQVVHSDELSARVEVWAVAVIAVAEVGAPRQVWRTVTVDLVWEHGDWRVDGWTARSGPTPALAVHAPVATVEDVAQVVSWPSVGRG